MGLHCTTGDFVVHLKCFIPESGFGPVGKIQGHFCMLDTALKKQGFR